MAAGTTYGGVTIDAAGQPRQIRFSWRSLDEIEAKWGKGWQFDLEHRLSHSRPSDLAFLLSVSTDLPEEFWMAESPPLVETSQVLAAAVALAFFGPGGAPVSSDPPMPRSVIARLLSWLGRRFGSGAEPA